MQQAISYKPWPPIDPINLPATARTRETPPGKRDELLSRPVEEDVREAVRESAVLVIGRRGCCMSHVVRRLLLGHGVNPAVCEVDEADERRIVEELRGVGGGILKDDGSVQFPAVFIGGRLFGGLDRVMASHITGELVPILKQAGALWL